MDQKEIIRREVSLEELDNAVGGTVVVHAPEKGRMIGYEVLRQDLEPVRFGPHEKDKARVYAGTRLGSTVYECYEKDGVRTSTTMQA